VKRRHYTSAGVPEYGVIDLDARVLEVSRAGDGGRYEPIDDRVTWHPDPAPEPLMIDVAGHFERVLGPETA
jgi:Uma2 family endonuclease